MSRLKPEQPRRRRLLWLRGLCGAQVVLVVLVGGLGDLVGERHWLTTLFAYAPMFPLCLPLLLLLPLALLVGDRRAMGLIALSVLPLPWLLGFVGWRRSAGTKEPIRLSVLTYNIRHGDLGPEKIAAALRTEGADVVCLQEVSGFQKSPDPLPILRKALPGWSIERRGEVAIASRHPLVDVHVISYGIPELGRVALSARVKGIRVVCAHLATGLTTETIGTRRRNLPTYLAKTATIREAQVRVLLDTIASEPGPVVLCGDFNTPPRGFLYHTLQGTLTDSFAATGSGLGYSFRLNRLAAWRIDYIWARGLTPTSATVLPWRVSDHKPLRVTF